MKNPNLRHSSLTSKIIKAAYYVHDYLGFGHLESVYLRALAVKLKQNGYMVDIQYPIKVYFEQELVGDFRADLIVDELVIVELKAVKKLHPIHEVQLVNYLKCTEIEVGLIINFGEELSFKRKVFDNELKRSKFLIP